MLSSYFCLKSQRGQQLAIMECNVIYLCVYDMHSGRADEGQFHRGFERLRFKV